MKFRTASSRISVPNGKRGFKRAYQSDDRHQKRSILSLNLMSTIIKGRCILFIVPVQQGLFHLLQNQAILPGKAWRGRIQCSSRHLRQAQCYHHSTDTLVCSTSLHLQMKQSTAPFDVNHLMHIACAALFAISLMSNLAVPLSPCVQPLH